VPVAPLVRFEGGRGVQPARLRADRRALHRRRAGADSLLCQPAKWSRFAHVTLVPDEREEALIRALLAAFEAFGGVPLVTVWDNPKTVVLSRKGDLIVWNAIFGQVAVDYRFAPSCAGRARGNRRAPSKILSAGSKAASSAAVVSMTAPISRPSSRSGSPP
jgi:hypothetical protein